MAKDGCVTVDFFCGAIKLLERLNKDSGPRGCGPAVEELRAGLAQAEAAYLSPPAAIAPLPKKRKEAT